VWAAALFRPEGWASVARAAHLAAMCNCRTACRWLPVGFVLALITWCYFIYLLDICVALLQLKPGESKDIGSYEKGVAYVIVFHLLFVLGMISFVRAVTTDPGRIPDSWVVGSEDAEAAAFFPQLQTLEVKHDGTRRICRKSKPNVYKPDRAHYCKMLSRCVLKMDHFCPWLNNCIGFYNHKFFYLFIFYMMSLVLFMLGTMTPTFVHDVTDVSDVDVDFSKEFRVTLTYLILCLLAVGLVGFWGFHTYLLASNYTTIEFLEKRGCNPPPDHVNRYDIGMWGNITSVLGANPLAWLFPCRCSCEGDGLSYKLNPEWYPSKGR